jgi:hypothetical protein
MNQLDSRLSAALRRLDTISPQSAPSHLGEMLRHEFRKHQLRRRRQRNARILLFAACLAGSVGVSVILRSRPSNTIVIGEPPPAMAPPRAIASVGQTEAKTKKRKPVRNRIMARSRNNLENQASQFVALPTFDPAIPIDHLEMVRVDLPGRALRLVGFPVSEEVADRRIVADVLLAQDGTPYALRLVQNSRIEEQ